jgi:RNase adaptor protein for sRNA GlmZ degradation
VSPLWSLQLLYTQVRDQEEEAAVAVAMRYAEDAKHAEAAALRAHQEVLESVYDSKRRLHELQEQRTMELAAKAAACEELGGKQTEIAKLKEKLTATSRQMQSQHASKVVESAAQLMEARAVWCPTGLLIRLVLPIYVHRAYYLQNSIHFHGC